MAYLAAGCHQYMTALCEALGLGTMPVEKLVIECSVSDLVHVYVKGFLTSDKMPAMVEWCKLIPVKDVTVTVADNGDVVVVVDTAECCPQCHKPKVPLKPANFMTVCTCAFEKWVHDMA